MAKSKIPMYPRPVSPLSAEPLPSNPNDIFLDDSSDSPSDDEQRAAKRRRIEKLGEQYLRGDGLVIMTASLRGPLTGWVNPWAKRQGQIVVARSETSKRDGEDEVPESTLRTPWPSKNAVPARPTDCDVARGPFLHGQIKKGNSNSGKKWLKKSRDHKEYSSAAHYNTPTPIRKCDKLQNGDHSMTTTNHQHTTSNPPVGSADLRLPAGILKQISADENPRPTPSLCEDAKQDCRADVQPLPSHKSSRSHGSAVLSKTKFLPMPLESGLPEQRGARTNNLAAQNTTVNGGGEPKRGSVHRLSPSPPPPDFDCRPRADTLKSLGKSQEERNTFHRPQDEANKPPHVDVASSAGPPYAPCQLSISGQAGSEKQAAGTTARCDGNKLKLANEPLARVNSVKSPSVPLMKMPRLSLSTQTSATTNTNAMPSAQVVPTVQRPSAESYHSTASRMIEPEITPPDNTAIAQQSSLAKPALPADNNQHKERATTVAKPTTPGTSWREPNNADGMQRSHSHEGIVPFGAFKSSMADTAVPGLDTQHMLATITPLGFSPVKKIPWKPINEHTPATATWVKPGKGKKRASFAVLAAADAVHSRSSMGSIKDCLRVSKAVHRERKAEESLEQLSQPAPFGKLGLDMETSDEDGGPGGEDSVPGLSSPLRSKAHPFGAPFSSAPLLAANTMTSTGSRQQQDAQVEWARLREDGQNGGGRQDDFNLTSALDDLGSFLGTWDADKEAREYGSVTSSSGVKSILKSKSTAASVRR